MRQTSEPKNLETLASRIRWIIEERQIKQTDFARSLGISVNYVYLLTSGRKTSISETLARLIERTYGYSAQWVLSGKRPELAEIADSDLKRNTIQKVKGMDKEDLRAVAAFIHSLQNADEE